LGVNGITHAYRQKARDMMTHLLGSTGEQAPKKRSNVKRFCFLFMSLAGAGLGGYLSVERAVSAFDRSSQALQLAAQNRVRTDARFEELLKSCLDGRHHTPADPRKSWDDLNVGESGNEKNLFRSR
jgi:hypothetical protein